MQPILLPVDALTDLPGGLIAAVVTHLELRRPPAAAPAPPPADIGLAPLRGAQIARYLELFRAVGEDWLWFSRLRLGPAALAAILDDPGVSALAVTRGGRDIGLVELDARAPGETELAYFGLAQGAIGQGLAAPLLGEAIARAFARPIARLTVHTCTLDHPRALAAYRRAGFVPVRQSIEIARDPRLAGLIPCEAAPHIPMLP